MIKIESPDCHTSNIVHQVYSTPLEHINDLMFRQELLTHRAIIHFQKRFNQTNREFIPGFLAISDEEINELLAIKKQKDTENQRSHKEQAINDNIELLEQQIAHRVTLSIQSEKFLPLVELAKIFNLSSVETDVLITCLASEIDQRYERFYGYLQDDISRKRPSIGLALALCNVKSYDIFTFRRIFQTNAPLLKYRLLSVSGEKNTDTPFLSRILNIDDRIVSFLLNEICFDSRIHSVLKLTQPKHFSFNKHTVDGKALQLVNDTLKKNLEKPDPRRKMIFYLHGGDQSTRNDLAVGISQIFRLPLLELQMSQNQAGTIPVADLLFYTLREALLFQAVSYIPNSNILLNNENSCDTTEESLIRLLFKMGSIIVIGGESRWTFSIPEEKFLFVPIELNDPDYDKKMTHWADALSFCDHFSEPMIVPLLSKYALSPKQINNAVARARAASEMRGQTITSSDLHMACRAQNTANLGNFAVQIQPKRTWDDLVLPAAQFKQLHDICDQITNRALVFEKWGFGNKLAYGKGLHALFSGPAGTGKTMAAEVLANELQLDIYKIDLSQVVSKYIGETEKNLNRIFSQAETGHAILLFDEADALLGKRSEVKDAHDRYANLEIAFLLQKMEDYNGVSILTTNLRHNLDDAFTRRIRFIVEFPFPDEDNRRQLWQRIWPPEAPLRKDIDFLSLSKRYKLTGGNIRNIVLSAAFYASKNGGYIEMNHLLDATKEEFRKMGRLIDDKEYCIHTIVH